MKYLFLILSGFIIQSCEGQKQNNKFSQMIILEKSNIICGKNSSSQLNYSTLSKWKLSKQDIVNIFNNSEKIDVHILHYSYGNLPCEIEGKMKNNGKMKKFIINAGGYFYLDDELYGCNSPECYKYFPPEARENNDE